jgi:hypothetical protein
VIPEVPEGFVVRAVYAPPEHRRNESWIALVADRRYSRSGQFVTMTGAALVAAGIVVRVFAVDVPSALPDSAFGVGALAGVAGWLLVNPPGRSGYYDVRDDGTLGGKIDKEELDLNGWHRIPVEGT